MTREINKVSILIIVIFLILILFIKSYYFSRPNYSFRIYYNKINSSILDEMGNYDINIVEASFFTKEDVDIIHSKNSKVIGYLSLIEIGSWDLTLNQKIKDEDFLKDSNNKRLMNLSENNYLGNLFSDNFKNALLDILKTRIIDKNMDGVFFDTLDWIDYYKNDTTIYNQLITGYKDFIKQVKELYPELMIIQNRSFTSYNNFSKKYVDGLLWENFNSPYIENDETEIKMLKSIKRNSFLYKTNIFVLSFINEDINRELSKKLKWNFLFSQMEKRYSNWNVETR
ncbi:MAG: endo alpha-1,4 polygalactosaminidase [Pleomorphochaeta sp.]